MTERAYVSFVEVKQKISVPDVLEVLGVADQFQQIGQTLTGTCPLPDHRHGPQPNRTQFKVNVKDGISLWHCFGDCQRGGDVIEFAKAMTGYDDAHIRFWFVEHFGERLTLRKPKPRKESPRKKEAAPANPGKDYSQAAAPVLQESTIPSAPSPLKPLRFFLQLNPTVPYLHRDRGLKPETINRYGLGLCRKGSLAGYIAIPVYSFPREPRTNPVGYLGRWPGEDYDEAAERPRYKFPSDFPRNQVVYGLQEALENSEGRPLIVVEGPFKVYHLFQAGFPHTVATFGASLSDEQADILSATGRPIVLLFDGNAAGHQGMRVAAAKLITRAFVRVVKLPTDTEPDEFSAEQLRDYLP